jgi:hypothetical protein
MQAIEVTARFDPAGNVTPIGFVRDGKTYPVTETGRSWSEGSEFHVLCLAPGMGVCELVFRSDERRWYLARPSAPVERV